ncbi:MAG TPA: class I SAM-dependent rRNA methyltransferase [Thermoanaerobaculia bacterium]|jgi:23S rRNA (cytosine1962-C5)-methyltransferase
MMIIELFAPQNRKRLVLKRGRERAVANRHPWLFTGAIAGESGPDDAAIADLVDERGALLASGFHSKHSQIRLRALTFGEELTADVIRERIVRAVARRTFSDDTNAFRVVNAEGDDLSGLVVDRYDDIVVVEIANAGVEKIKPLIVETIQHALSPRGIFFKNDIPARKLERLSQENEWSGAGHPAAKIRESGLSFVVEPAEGQKTGFFLDQRENRRIARSLAGGKRVLNLFSYSGAFGVYAAAGGAASVMNVDVSEKAIALARTNHELNGFGAEFVAADAFDWIRQSNDRFDLVICDPPAFAKSRGDIDRAARGYKDINLQSLRHVAPRAMLMTFSCSGHMSLDLFQKVIFSAAADAGRRASIVRRLTAAPDHPVSLYCPEGEYLKGFLLAVE